MNQVLLTALFLFGCVCAFAIGWYQYPPLVRAWDAIARTIAYVIGKIGYSVDWFLRLGGSID